MSEKVLYEVIATINLFIDRILLLKKLSINNKYIYCLTYEELVQPQIYE